MSILSISYQLKYKEAYEREKSHITMSPDAFDIRAAKEAYQNISNVRQHQGALILLPSELSVLVSLFALLFFCSWTTKRSMKPIKQNGYGPWTDLILYMHWRLGFSKVMWVSFGCSKKTHFIECVLLHNSMTLVSFQLIVPTVPVPPSLSQTCCSQWVGLQ